MKWVSVVVLLDELLAVVSTLCSWHWSSVFIDILSALFILDGVLALAICFNPIEVKLSGLKSIALLVVRRLGLSSG